MDEKRIIILYTIFFINKLLFIVLSQQNKKTVKYKTFLNIYFHIKPTHIIVRRLWLGI